MKRSGIVLLVGLAAAIGFRIVVDVK